MLTFRYKKQQKSLTICRLSNVTGRTKQRPCITLPGQSVMLLNVTSTFKVECNKKNPV